MDLSFEDPEWWTNTIDFDFNEHDGGAVSTQGHVDRFPLPADPRSPNDAPISIDPNDLQLAQQPQSGHVGGVPIPYGLASDDLAVSNKQHSSALDDFLTSQGGWRPPVPCTHCKRLRLQCFMLQTTQDNPNPVRSCSSCVALYRHCSLAGPAKRVASQFETPRPVIGQLHGVYEDDAAHASHMAAGNGAVPDVGLPSKPSKRSSSRSNTGTRPLRIWFNDHLERPFPSESEKRSLACESGLSNTQVANWFSNARRRKKHVEQATAAASKEIHRNGSPMPVSGIPQMTPFERWQHSPPEDDPANFADIEHAIDVSSSTSSLSALQGIPDFDHVALPIPEFDHDLEWLSLPASLDSSSNATSSCTSQQSFGARSTSSKRSFGEDHLGSAPRKRRQCPTKSHHQCSHCARTFTRKSDMLRHERAIHLHSNDKWICSDLILPDESPLIWRISDPTPSCAFCGQPAPDQRHFLSHEFVACADRSVDERTFTRKDHLWQHLYKFHKCRKWDGWNLDERMEKLRRPPDGQG